MVGVRMNQTEQESEGQKAFVQRDRQLPACLSPGLPGEKGHKDALELHPGTLEGLDKDCSGTAM